MKALLKIWEWLDGRKTTIGAILMFLVLGAEGMGWLPEEVASWLKSVVMSWTALGLGHKALKLSK